MSLSTKRSRKRSRRHGSNSALEALESRTLLSAIIGHSIDAQFPLGTTHDNLGNLWVADPVNGAVDKITVDAAGNITSNTAFAIGDTPQFLTFNPVNNHIYIDDVSFVNDFKENITEIDTDGNVVNVFQIPDQNQQAIFIAAATDGSVWFTTLGADAVPGGFEGRLYRMDMGGNFTSTLVPIVNSTPLGLAGTADGAMWFSVQGSTDGSDGENSNVTDSALGRATFDGSSIQFNLFNIPTPKGMMNGLAADGNSVWYAEADTLDVPRDRPLGIDDRIGHAVWNGGNSASFTEYLVPKAPDEGVSAPGLLSFDSSGRLWIAENTHLSYMDPSTGEFTRMPLPSGQAVSMTVTDGDVWLTAQNGDSNLFQVHLNDFTDPVVATSPDIAAFAGQQYSGPIAIFSSDVPGDFSYTLDYGDNQVVTGTIVNDGSGVYAINGSQTYNTAGTYNTTLTITDGAGDVLTFAGTAVVEANVPLVAQGVNVSGQEDVAIAPNVTGVSTLVVAQFSGPAASYTATIQWGDTTTSTGVVVSTGDNNYYVKLATGQTKTYGTQGTYNISVTITDGTNSVTATSQATITDTPLVVSQNLVLVPQTGRVFNGTVATFSDDIDSTASWFSATINWGDGKTSKGVIVKDLLNPGHYLVLSSHVFAGKKGVRNVSVLIKNLVENVQATATALVDI